MQFVVRKPPGQTEFIALVAFVMAMISLSIDNLLPAFAPIRREFVIGSANDLQLIVTVYMVGSGLMQIVYGTLSDVVGRRPTLLAGILLYAIGAGIGMVAHDYQQLLAGRLVQGMGAAAAQVLSMALILDRYSGREMARVMSLVFMVFIMVPVIAPALGSVCIALWGWRSVFASMLLMSVAVAVWFGLRMPETLHPEHKRAFSLQRIGAGIVTTLSHRGTVGYGIAIALMMGCLMTYVSSSQQIFETEVYGLGAWFPQLLAALQPSWAWPSLLTRTWCVPWACTGCRTCVCCCLCCSPAWAVRLQWCGRASRRCWYLPACWPRYSF